MATDTITEPTTITAPNFTDAVTYINNMTTAVYSVMEETLIKAGLTQAEVNTIKNIGKIKTSIGTGIEASYNIYQGDYDALTKQAVSTIAGVAVAALVAVAGVTTLPVTMAAIAGIAASSLVSAYWPEIKNFFGDITQTAMASAADITQEIIDTAQFYVEGFVLEAMLFMYDLSGAVADFISDLFNTNFSASQVWQPPRDPLAFDLDGDGIETLAENGNAGVLFDHEGNDVKTATGWIAPDDGFLVYDRNGNGVIDNGTELFGDNTALNAGGTAANGFEALADFDTNADGVVDVNDANFAGLRIWQDINSDGISQADELLTLAQAGVASINTGYEDSSIAQNGNVISGLGSYTRTDGTLSSIASATSLVNLDLANSSFYSAFVNSIPVTAEAALLPNMNGSGMVRNMRAAA